MPSKSLRQHNAMAAAAEGRSDLGIPQKVGRDYLKADKGRKFVRRKKAARHTLKRRTT